MAILKDELTQPEQVTAAEETVFARRSGILTAEELDALNGHDALVLDHVSKRFVKRGGAAWWRSLIPGRKASKSSKRIIRAVDDVTLPIQRREIFGVLGSNGSGKSTLIRLISTLLMPDTGRIEVFGHDVVREERAVQRLINRV